MFLLPGLVRGSGLGDYFILDVGGSSCGEQPGWRWVCFGRGDARTVADLASVRALFC